MFGNDPDNPYGGEFPDDDTGGGGYTGGTDPNNPPHWRPDPDGWWEFIDGVWRWMTTPAPGTVRNLG